MESHSLSPQSMQGCTMGPVDPALIGRLLPFSRTSVLCSSAVPYDSFFLCYPYVVRYDGATGYLLYACTQMAKVWLAGYLIYPPPPYLKDGPQSMASG